MTYDPFHLFGADRPGDVIVICDHASNHVPTAVAGGDLGLPAADMNRHIAYDIGAKGVSVALGEALDAPVICSNFSRLVIDPNRGEDDPTLLMRLYDGTMIPANRHADEAELQARLDLCYRPYHRALGQLVTARKNPIIISIHSFTPQLRGRPKRPWHIGILSNHDRRLSDPLLEALIQHSDIVTGDNVPYSGALKNDTMDQHALGPGHLHTLIEIRNDLIETEAGQQEWADRLAPVVTNAIAAAKET